MRYLRRLTFLVVAIVMLVVSVGFARDGEPRYISGVYPDLSTYGQYSLPGGAFNDAKSGECGIGAVVPWAGKLWMINYAPHRPEGSEHKLYSVDSEMKLMVHPQSVGGTPAARMIHRESNQLLIGPYFIDAAGKVRVIPPSVMPGRLTAITRHLTDPENMVYYFDMEGMLYEANVHTLESKLLFKKVSPGWHGKGAYVAQGRLVIANNGENNWQTEKTAAEDVAPDPENAGALSQWDGKTWEVVERRQFTDVTGPGGIYGAARDDDPLWTMGWDRRSIRLKLLEDGEWYTFLLPKGQHCNDPRHGWFTEWPRIREVGEGRMLMNMHGMFLNFPRTFSKANTAGITPIATHLRYIPDFCDWDGRLVIATDETSIMQNKLAGQPQSNLWVGKVDDLKTWGPASGWGGIWSRDLVKADTFSDPFLIDGFDRRVLHLAVSKSLSVGEEKSADIFRFSNSEKITEMPAQLAGLPRVSANRGDFHKPAPGYQFVIDQNAIVYLAVDARGKPTLGQGWDKTDIAMTWRSNYKDIVYRKSFGKGLVVIPGNDTEHKSGDFGTPHTAFIKAKPESNGAVKITGLSGAPGLKVTRAGKVTDMPKAELRKNVAFTLEIDPAGKGDWEDYTKVAVAPGGYVFHSFPKDLKSVWVRLKTDRECVATAFFHLTDKDFHSPKGGRKLFGGLADVGETGVVNGAHLFPAKRNRNLRVINAQAVGSKVSDEKYFDFTKGDFEFVADEPDIALKERLAFNPIFTVDAASVIIEAKGERFRLPKGDLRFDKPFAFGWPRDMREVESERNLANIHGTFYEIPRGDHHEPRFDKMRPVSSHGKQIADFCSWNGLLVMSGVRGDAKPSGHVYRAKDGAASLWFGAIDDLWTFGKPVGKGGPWKNAEVKAGVASDPYLMTGYDKKSVSISASEEVSIKIEVDVDHNGWHTYKMLKIPAGKTVTHTFPSDYSAHWVRVTADRDCMATVMFFYE